MKTKINILWIALALIGFGIIMFFIWHWLAATVLMISLSSLVRLNFVKIAVNTCATYRNRWSGRLVDGTMREGWHFLWFLTYIIDEDGIDASLNEFAVEVEAETLNDITVTQPASLWTRVENARDYRRIGLDDVKEMVTKDWEDTVKAFVATKTDLQLRELQNKNIGLELFNLRDTLFEKTLPKAGLLSDIDEIFISFGTVKLPASIKAANQAKVEKQRQVEGQKIDNTANSDLVSTILIEILISDLPNWTKKKLRGQAINNLNLTIDPNKPFDADTEYDITDEMLSIAEKKAEQKATSKGKTIDLIALRREANQVLDIREGRTKSYAGLGNATAILGNVGGNN